MGARVLTDRQTDKQTNKQTNKQTDKPTDQYTCRNRRFRQVMNPRTDQHILGRFIYFWQATRRHRRRLVGIVKVKVTWILNKFAAIWKPICKFLYDTPPPPFFEFANCFRSLIMGKFSKPRYDLSRSSELNNTITKRKLVYDFLSVPRFV